MLLKNLRTFLSIAFFLLAPLAYAQSTYSDFYFFGDSLSDIGNGNQNQGCLTNRDANTNECLTWANDLYFAEKGIYAKPSSQGGTNYAVGGAVSMDLNKQVAQYMADHHNQVDPNAYYFFLIGANDLINMSDDTYNTMKTDADNGNLIESMEKIAQTLGYYNTNLESTPASKTPGVVSNEVDLIKQFYDAGAQHIMVINLPDITATPRMQNSVSKLTNSCQASIFIPEKDKSMCLLAGQAIFGLTDTFVRDFNGTLARLIALQKFDPNRVKIYSMYDGSREIRNSGKFDNINMCSGTAEECSHNLFFNDIHPTAAAHKLMEQEIQAML